MSSDEPVIRRIDDEDEEFVNPLDLFATVLKARIESGANPLFPLANR